MSQPIGNLPIDAKVKFGTIYGRAIQWQIKSKYHAGYPSGAITIVTKDIIKLLCVDAKEASNSDSNRRSHGNNRHIYTNLRQWLNKRGTNWYTAAHSADAPPTYDDIEAFLSGFTQDEEASILTTTLTVNKASVDGSGQETFTDKIFSLSSTEVGFTADTADGSKLDGFTADNASRLAYPTADCVANSDYTNSGFKTSSPWYYWLRTPYASSSYIVRHVSTSGALLSEYVASYNGLGLRPACNLASTDLVSDSPDSDGCYTLLYNDPPSVPPFINVPEQVYVGVAPAVSWGASVDPEGTAVSYILERKYNSGSFAPVYSGPALTFSDAPIPAGNTTILYRVKAVDSDGVEGDYITSASRSIIMNSPPTITGTDTDLGVFANDPPPAYAYTVQDADGGPVTVTEKLGETVLRSYTPTLGQQQQLVFSAADWRAVLNGTHTIKITAQDPQSGQATRTLTFTKNVDNIEFYGPINALPADGMPSCALVNMVASMPAGCILTAYICNNGNDEAPTWEDCTQAIKTGTTFYFTNTEKTAGLWGVKLHIKLERGTATGAVYIASVGGNYK